MENAPYLPPMALPADEPPREPAAAAPPKLGCLATPADELGPPKLAAAALERLLPWLLRPRPPTAPEVAGPPKLGYAAAALVAPAPPNEAPAPPNETAPPPKPKGT